jgi:hypothetical protein
VKAAAKKLREAEAGGGKVKKTVEKKVKKAEKKAEKKVKASSGGEVKETASRRREKRT